MGNSIRAVVIGGGGTGIAVAHDLCLREIETTLLERGELTSGTTGRHHGQLHSGARYAVGDPSIAAACKREVEVLLRIAPQSIEMNYGLFLALTDEDMHYGATFQAACEDAGIPTRRISIDDALLHEPAINPNALLAVVVPDGTIDAYRLPMQFAATATANGARLRRFAEVVGVSRRASGGFVVHFRNHITRADEKVDADVVVNAAGPWAGRIAALIGVDLPLKPTAGTLLAVKKRVSNMVISRLHPRGSGDIIVPQRGLSIVGTTEKPNGDPDTARPYSEDIAWLRGEADGLIPGFSRLASHAAWSAVRPLIGSEGADRGLSRDYRVVHHDVDGSPGFFSVVGGKATTLRAMAETTVDLLCQHCGVDSPCVTATTPLRDHKSHLVAPR